MAWRHYLLAALSLSVASGAASAPNLIPDSSFETGIQDWNGYPGYPYRRSEEKAHSGKFSLPFPQGKGHELKSENPAVSQPVTGMQSGVHKIEPGAKYRFKLFVLADGACKVTLADGNFGEVYNYRHASVQQQIPNDGQWHEVSLDIQPPDFVEYLVVFAGVAGKGWLDDVSLEKIADATLKPFALDFDAAQYLKPGETATGSVTIANNSPADAKVKLSLQALRLGEEPSPALYPPQGYTVSYKTLNLGTKTIPAGASRSFDFELDTTGLPESGLLLAATALDEAGKPLGSKDKEIFICARPDYRTDFSIGSQYYHSDRFNGVWTKRLKDFGGDAIRQHWAWNYREAIPGVITQYPEELRNAYLMRLGLKWICAPQFLCGASVPPWLGEDTGGRITYPDGTLMAKAGVCWHSEKTLEAVEAGAKLTGRTLQACPGVYGVQLDNEVHVIDCYCEDAQRSFRDYLLDRYGSLEQLNAKLGTSFQADSEIRQPPPLFSGMDTEGASGLDLPQPAKRAPALDFQWLKWRQAKFTDYYRRLANAMREEAPGLPLMDNFMLYVDIFPRGFFECPLNLMDFATFFDVGGLDATPSVSNKDTSCYQMDWLNSAWEDRPVWIPESSQPWATAKAREVAFNIFFYAGRKVQNFQIFNWPVLQAQGEGLHGSGVAFERAQVVDNLKADIKLARGFDKTHSFGSLHYVQPNVGVYWAEDILDFPLAMGARPWLAGTDAIFETYRLVADTHYPVKFIEEKRLNHGDEPQLKALFVGGAYVLDCDTFKNMLDFADDGGTLFLNGPAGFYDKDLRPYADAPCGLAQELGVKLGAWKGGSSSLFSDGAEKYLKLGRNRLVRGFGSFASRELSKDWKTLLKDANGQPALVTRPYGDGRLFWALSDIANPYATFRGLNSSVLVEGVLEDCGVGRLVKVCDGAEPAWDVAVAVKNKDKGEDFLFLNNFGKAGDFTLHLNVDGPVEVSDALTGERLALADHALALKIDHLDFKVLRLKSNGIDYAKLLPRPVLPVQRDLPERRLVGGKVAAPTSCSLVEGKADDGTGLLNLNGPFLKLSISPAHGGRVVSLGKGCEELNQILPVDGITKGAGSTNGGLKPILSPLGASCGGVAFSKPFEVKKRSSTGVELSFFDPETQLGLDETLSISQDDPALRWKIRQRAGTKAYEQMRLYFHGALLLGGEVKKDVRFAGGDGKTFKSTPYVFGKQAPVPFAFPVTWGAVVDREAKTVLLCVPSKGFDALNFWNGMKEYNLEIGSAFSPLPAGGQLEGELAFYLCSGLADVNFVAEGLAGDFKCWSENAGQYVKVSACSLSGKARSCQFVVKGVDAKGQEREFGVVELTAAPVDAVTKTLSLGGNGTGYAKYLLFLRAAGAADVKLCELPGNLEKE